MKDKILKLLESKFQGTRKDGLATLAGVLSLTATTDEAAAAAVDALTADAVSNFVTEFRKAADAEITKATKTAEENLRQKYDFVEKGKKPQPPEPDKQNPPAPNFEEALKEAMKPYLAEIEALKGANVKATRRGKLEKAIEAAPASVKDLMLENFDNTTFNDDTAYEEYLAKATEKATTMAQELSNNQLGNLGRPQFGTVNDNDVSAGMKAYVEAKKQQKK